jgi:3-oxoacyl-[acyl-carrier protein] reductase
MDKSGITVLITGSSKGIGRGLALEFAKNNFNIIIHGRNKKDLKKVCEEVEKNKVSCLSIGGDITKKETLDKLFKIAVEKDVSVLINNAGLPCPHLPLQKIKDKQIDDIIQTNLIAPLKLTRRIYDFFINKKSGTIININSLSGMENHYLRTIYCSSKWGLRGFTDTLRKEANDKNVRVIGIYPGRTMTRPEYTYGMTVEHIAKQIFNFYKSSKKDDLIIDNHPKKG